MKKLGAAGISTVEIRLSGRFHTTRHQRVVTQLSNLCELNQAFKLPEAAHLQLPCLADVDPTRQGIVAGNLSSIALDAILVQPSDWWKTFTALGTIPGRTKIVVLTQEKCAPPSVVSNLPARFQLLHLAELIKTERSSQEFATNENDIAVVGMACKVAGADDIDEFWDILCEGRSQHTEVPKSRLGFKTAFRDTDESRKWYGNFLKFHDAFDHRFFKKTPREAASMDPQQRILLEIAYQAVSQSGYFHTNPHSANVGCFIGTCAVDYEYNVGCHAPNAFSSTGNLRGFIAGKVSHHFGWTGPSLTLDTACSGAAVAVHQACKAILSGECVYALAGGVNVITQPLAYQNLAAASFLSQTGQCKPFCVRADGYCRGEGVGAVFLKKKSAAIADGDQVFGLISSTAVLQNQNCTPIFVPNAPSLSGLFEHVLDKAKLKACQISYVEAHGTGTPVGDPAEYESISRIFAVAERANPVHLGSVKGLIGHTESSSGLVSLIKVLLMMHYTTIPPQPSHHSLSHSIEPNQLVNISTSLKPWGDHLKAALINNYGASGSNASMIVRQFTPDSGVGVEEERWKYPFWISANDERSLQAYAERLGAFLSKRACQMTSFIRDLAFNVCRQSNRRLPKVMLLECSTVEELQQRLGKPVSAEIATAPQVILCFGGQVSTYVGLDRGIVANTTILRFYLDRCDQLSKDLGFDGIYPEIFQKSPICDIVKLQLCLFSSQYSSAMSWMSCGVQPCALVGHSFGELTALCVSEVLSLPDAIKIIAGRAKVIREQWGSDKGSMMAVETDLQRVEAILSTSNSAEESASIACHNGPNSFTLAGTTQSIKAVERCILRDKISPPVRWKKLNVTNAFHSSLVDDLRSELEQMARAFRFRKPTIPIEFATKERYTEDPGMSFIASHMRNPVYFHHAVNRLSERLQACVWLEAGSGSTITQMVSRALSGAGTTSHSFVPVDIVTGSATSNLTRATVDLWKAGINATFWQHHPSQTSQHATLILPPYQFERSRHWLELREPSSEVSQVPRTEKIEGLWEFSAYQDEDHRAIRFRVRCESDQYKAIVSSHTIARTAPICPATLEVDMAIDALMSVSSEFRTDGLQPQILNVENHAPVCFDSSRILWLDLMAKDPGTAPSREWTWSLTSEKTSTDAAPTVHVTGEFVFCHADDQQVQTEFSRYERLVTHQRCVDLLYGNDPNDDIVQGSRIYRIFDDIVQYGPRFQGLNRLVGRSSTNESAGRVTKKYQDRTWLDADLSDCFSQVGGIWVNCMTGKAEGDMYIANGFEKWVRSPRLLRGTPRPETWEVLACHERRGESTFLTDIFIFDPRGGTLVEVILGINFAKVSKLSMSRLLARLSADVKAPLAESAQIGVVGRSTGDETLGKACEPPTHDVVSKVRLILADLSGLETNEIKEDSHLADIGIDSLMGMELARELEGAFSCTLSTDALMEVFSFEGLVECIRQTLGLSESSDTSDANATSPDATDTAQSSTEEMPCDFSTCEVPSKEFISESLTVEAKMLSASSKGHLMIPSSAVLEAFAECKALTDHFIEDENCNGYLQLVTPRQTELCVALAIEAFAKLGCDLRLARAGQKLNRITHIPTLQGLVDYVYDMVEKESGIIENRGSVIMRTSVAAPSESSADILQALLHSAPEHQYPHMLTHFAGSRLAEVLSGKSDGIKVIFGTDEGRQLASGLYADSPLNKLSYMQMQDFVKRFVSKLPEMNGPLKVLELGAGTGGTTKWIVPLLVDLGIPVEYVFSDLSSSFVAAGRKRFGKKYPFMSFRVFDVEKECEQSLLGTQHMVLASNAVHATHNLKKSLVNIRQTLRPDGFIVILEMTRTIYWVDMIFGLLEGWWLFDDGRRHAIAHQSRWRDDLYSAGYSHVDWSDGNHPEATIQRVFLALNGEEARSPPASDIQARQGMIDAYVEHYTRDFRIPDSPSGCSVATDGLCVLVTGATGSLGSHIVAHLSQLPQVQTVLCLNRRGQIDPRERQLDAMKSRGIGEANFSKLEIVETDTASPMLGLEQHQYNHIASRITHVVHNAWPMSGKRPLKGFEGQFKAMRSLLDITSAAASAQGIMIGFQFISSIAVVGHQPTLTGNTLVLEERVQTAAAVLSNGYGDAKWTCERMLDHTLHKYPQSFRVMSVRPGQIAGSSASGYWNEMEHLSFMVKSSQTIGAFPALDGILSWTPVNDVAAVMCDLITHYTSSSYPVYHVDNPVRQPWAEMTQILSEAIGSEVVPFDEWLQRVHSCSSSLASGNPAAKLIEFFEHDFTRMSCGALMLDTTRACEHSSSLRAVRPVSVDLARMYVLSWRLAGVLKD